MPHLEVKVEVSCLLPGHPVGGVYRQVLLQKLRGTRQVALPPPQAHLQRTQAWQPGRGSREGVLQGASAGGRMFLAGSAPAALE